jgi:Protein of unknown function (DUF3240)
MNEPDSSTVAVTINVAPGAEERLIDWLLGRGDTTGFTSYAVYGHGANHEDLSIAEQVTGRQRRAEMRIELAHETLESFLAGLVGAFEGTDLYYAVTPVLRSGHLQRRS